jgi:hypothetical protein
MLLRAVHPIPAPASDDHLLEVVLTHPAHAGPAAAVLAPLSVRPPEAAGELLRVPVRGREGTIVDAVHLLDGAGLRARDLWLRPLTAEDLAA